MKHNYNSWDLDINHFYNQKSNEEKYKFLIKFAILAPSSHNTQPWVFEIEGNNIKIFRENKRRLPIADENDRQLFLSVGCSLANLLIAANYYGYNTEVVYSHDQSEDLVATVKLTSIGKIVNDPKHIIHFIKERRTNRSKYKNEVIPFEVLENVKTLLKPHQKINIIDDKETLYKLADVAIVASIESMISDDFRSELSHHIKSNVTRSKIGMPGFTLGLPTPVSFILPSLIRRFNMEKVSQKQNEKLFKKHTPYIAVLSTNEDKKRDWVEAGSIFQNISLLLAKSGISTSPWGAPIQIGGFFKDIQNILNIDYRPQMFFRLGYATKSARHSPRLTINEVLR